MYSTKTSDRLFTAFHFGPKVSPIKVLKLDPTGKFRFVSNMSKPEWSMQNQVSNKHANAHVNPIPADAIGKENIPAPTAVPAIIAIPPMVELGFAIAFMPRNAGS